MDRQRASSSGGKWQAQAQASHKPENIDIGYIGFFLGFIALYQLYQYQ
jgi:hypothetical protein